MKTLCSTIGNKNFASSRFFTEKIVVKEPVDNNHYCGGTLKRAVRDNSGEFMGCIGIGVIRFAG